MPNLSFPEITEQHSSKIFFQPIFFSGILMFVTVCRRSSWKGREMSRARDAINSMSQFIWCWENTNTVTGPTRVQQWTWILLPSSSPQPFVPGTIENLYLLLMTGTNPGKISVLFSLNVAMISFVRDLGAGSVSPTARLLLHRTPLGFMAIGVMDFAVIWEASVQTFCPLWRTLWSFLP